MRTAAVFFLFGIAVALADQPERKPRDMPRAAQASMAGVYHVKGMAGETPYYGVCTVREKEDGRKLLFIWSLGDKLVIGEGMRHGNSIAVSWASAGTPGLSLYEVKGGGLKGIWMLHDDAGGGPNPEELRFLRRLEDDP